jgi:dipeptidyl aminopeptidase/acylaminoacyl peptidase
MFLSAEARNSVAFSASGASTAFIAQDYEHGPEILAGSIARPRPITSANRYYPPLVRAQKLSWINEGYDLDGWLLRPAGDLPQGKAPLIVVVHGGPAAAELPRFLWQGEYADLIKAGYWLFYPNPRGSFGQGATFVEANRRDFGGGDLRDILAGVDAVGRAAPVDLSRLGLAGGSYGGFMAMWANTQSDRFKAIWAECGPANWISYAGTNGIEGWTTPYFGTTMYDDPDRYWKASPLKYVDRAKTPTLLTVGERDLESPPTQSVEYFRGLKAHGVPTSLVIYPDEGHGIHLQANVDDQRRRVVAWFDKYLRQPSRLPHDDGPK